MPRTDRRNQRQGRCNPIPRAYLPTGLWERGEGSYKVGELPAGLLFPQQRKLYGIQDDVKVLQLVDQRHATLFQGVVHHGITRRSG